jgi:prolyl-tRNA synthetase
MIRKHETGITVGKEENFSEWYRQILIKSKLIEYTDISGFYVLLPNSYEIWENIKIYLDGKFKKMGIKNSYFPLFITENNLTKEKNHIEGFSPEVMWTTHSGDDPLEEKLAVRPTSECAMYPVFKELITSKNDLPLRFNLSMV